MTVDSKNIAGQVARGSGILLIAKFLQRSLGLLSTLILARLLLPSDFAVVAIALLVVKLLEIISNTGARQYIVQVEKLGIRSLDTAWTLDLGCRLIGSVLLLSCLPIVHWFWSDTSITTATALLSPTLALAALQNPELHLDERRLRYDRFFRVDLARKFAGTSVTIVFAIVFESFWAIVAGTWVSALTGIFVSYRIYTYRPRFCTSGIKTQWNFSKWIVGRGFIGYLRAQIDVILASRFFDVTSFGQYTLARELTILPSTDLVVPLVQPLFATFSRAREREGMLGRQLCAATLFVSSVISPICMLLYAEGDVILLLALGDGWEPAASLVSPMVPLLFGFSFGGITNFLFLAQGKVRSLFCYDVISLTAVTASLIILGQGDIHRFVEVRAWLAVAIATVALLYCSRQIGVSSSRILNALISPVLVVIVSGIAADWLVRHVSFNGSNLSYAVLYAVVLFFVYTISMYAMGILLRRRSESWKDVVSFIGKLMGNAYIQAAKTLRK